MNEYFGNFFKNSTRHLLFERSFRLWKASSCWTVALRHYLPTINFIQKRRDWWYESFGFPEWRWTNWNVFREIRSLHVDINSAPLYVYREGSNYSPHDLSGLLKFGYHVIQGISKKIVIHFSIERAIRAIMILYSSHFWYLLNRLINHQLFCLLWCR